MAKGGKTLFVFILIWSLCLKAYSQSDTLTAAAGAASAGAQEEAVSSPEPAKAMEVISGGRISLDFKDADLRNVLKVLAYKSGVNIVASPEVSGNVSIKLNDVPWKEALKTILSAYGYGYDQRENIIMVAPLEKLTEQKKQEVELAQVQPTVTEVFNLKYIDAGDARKAIEPQLSSRGEVTILESTGQAGWEFGADEISKRKRISEGRISRSKTMIITDVPPVLDKIKKVIAEIDIKPQQILIEARIVEANVDKLKDIGLDWGTGSTGAEAGTMLFTPAGKNRAGNTTSEMAGHSLSDIITPAAFNPKSGTTGNAMSTVNTGLRLVYRKLTGAQFEAILHALQEDVMANTISAPRITTLNNQEATILVGQKYPLIKTDVSTESGKITGSTLDKYQDIGIQLNVVPQISDKEYINMIVHPAVTSYTQTVKAKTESDITLSEFPIINTREAETQILIKDSETFVIGGLLKDVKTKQNTGIPFLGKIPFIGVLFQRQTEDIEKIDLLIFITAHIVKEGEFNDAHIATLEERLNTFSQPKKDKKKKNNKGQ